MLFNSPEFLFVFLPVTLLGFFLVARLGQGFAAAWLGLASLVFYGWWNVTVLPLLVGSIMVNYALGRTLAAATAGGRPNKPLLVAALAANLALLGYFKYADFFLGTVNQLLAGWLPRPLPLFDIILPIGISFYTFTQIAFLVDCWQGKVRETRFVHYLLFVSYFPHLIAGPIIHHGQIMPQFRDPAIYRARAASFFTGLTIFGVGLAKKIVIADGLADFADPFFAAAAAGETIRLIDGWAGALAYSFQLYFDFSGYAEMAIGISLLFGITLPVNFASPYKAASIIEFWRRWHISLSTFLRDYLYVPLGGNRKGEPRRYLNLAATMLLGGLWHGAALTFVAWGAIHGGLLVLNHLWRQFGWPTAAPGALRRLAGVAATFIAVVFAWVVFRADSLTTAMHIWGAMAGENGAMLPEKVAQMLPFGRASVAVGGNMVALGAGSVMGVIEQLTLVAVAAMLAFFGTPTLAMSDRTRLLVIAASAGFVVNSLFFAIPKQFLYFQF